VKWPTPRRFEQAFDNVSLTAPSPTKPGLPKELVRILARRHGSGLDDLLENVHPHRRRSRASFRRQSLYEVEVRHLVRDEWAVERRGRALAAHQGRPAHDGRATREHSRDGWPSSG
jgi:glycerol-3-phosphate dehydrogenase